MTNREIKRRIGSVKETVKITKAMYSISVAKMLRAKEVVPKAEAYKAASEEMLSLVARSMAAKEPYFAPRGDRAGFLVIAGDKGLCGDFNQKVVECAMRAIREKTERYVFTVGSVTRESFRKAGVSPDIEFLNTAENPSPETASSIASDILYLFESDMLDEIWFVFTEVKENGAEVALKRVLPFAASEGEAVLIEPSESDLLPKAMERYLSAFVYYALISSSLAENLARVKAMPQATNNGEKMIAALTAKYNRLRQESITRALQDAGVSDAKL